MTKLNLAEDSTQWVLNVHISLEWWTWVYNDGVNIENGIGNSLKKTMYKQRK